MKKLIFLFFAFISLSASAQYVINRPIANKIVYGSNPVFVQSAKIMFTADGDFRTETNWNTIDQNITNASLTNSAGTLTAWKITVPSSNDWDIDGYPSNVGSGDFSVMALSKVVYNYGSGTSKTITFSSLNAAKVYKLRIAALYYDDPTGDDKTNITVNGVTKQLLMAVANTPYIVEFDGLTGTTISFTVSGAGSAIYPMISAAILEEYTP